MLLVILKACCTITKQVKTDWSFVKPPSDWKLGTLYDKLKQREGNGGWEWKIREHFRVAPLTVKEAVVFKAAPAKKCVKGVQRLLPLH